MTRTTNTTAAGRARRDQIVRAATQAFAARGYRAASMDAIAAEAGVTRQGLLHHFPSKVELLMGVLALRDEDDAALLATLREGDEPLVEILLAMFRHHARQPGLAQLFTVLSAESTDPEHPAHEWFVERYRRGRTVVAAWVAGEQARGRITRAIAPEPLTTAVLALMDGLQLQEQLEPGTLDIEQPLAELMALLTP